MMGRNKILVVAVIAIMMTIPFQRAAALKCWNCKFDAGRPKQTNLFCKEHFERDSISAENIESFYKECTTTIEKRASHDAYCRTLIQNVSSQTVVSRSCYYKPKDAPKDQCSENDTASFMKTIDCQKCVTDGCNSATQFGPFALLIIIPMAIAKILSF